MTGFLAKLLLTTLLATLLPLTDAQRLQLDSARDSIAQTDEGALYPLLENAMLWPANQLAGAKVPDYAAILANPAEHRGELFLIEGMLRRAQPIGRLALPGPWDESLSEWAIQYGDDPQKLLVVNLVAPPGQPVEGSRVKLAARFYKLWATTNTKNEPRTYMVFVGRDAQVLATPRAFALNGQVPTSVLVLCGCMGVFALFWVIRRAPKMSLNPSPTPGQHRRRQAREMQKTHANRRSQQGDQAADAQVTQPEAMDAVESPVLPGDPAEALAMLDQQSPSIPSSNNPDDRE